MPRGIPRPLSLARAGGWGVARPTVYLGHRYRSKAEADYAARLETLRRTGRIREWRRAPFFRIEIGEVYCGRYTPDFEVTHLDGRVELVEVKGWPSREFTFRYNVFRATHPTDWITVVDSAGVPYDPNAHKSPGLAIRGRARAEFPDRRKQCLDR